MRTLSTPLSKEEKHAHNEIAALLSIVPGLGVGLAWDAYNEKDRRHHHLASHWPEDDESPD